MQTETTDSPTGDSTSTSTATDETPTDESVPGFGVVIAIVALVGAALLGRHM